MYYSSRRYKQVSPGPSYLSDPSLCPHGGHSAETLRCFLNNFCVSYIYIRRKYVVLFRSVVLVPFHHTWCCARPTSISAFVQDFITFTPHFSHVCDWASSAWTQASRSQGHAHLAVLRFCLAGLPWQILCAQALSCVRVFTPRDAVPRCARLPWRTHVSSHLCASIWEDVTSLVFNSQSLSVYGEVHCSSPRLCSRGPVPAGFRSASNGRKCGLCTLGRPTEEPHRAQQLVWLTVLKATGHQMKGGCVGKGQAPPLVPLFDIITGF